MSCKASHSNVSIPFLQPNGEYKFEIVSGRIDGQYEYEATNLGRVVGVSMNFDKDKGVEKILHTIQSGQIGFSVSCTLIVDGKGVDKVEPNQKFNTDGLIEFNISDIETRYRESFFDGKPRGYISVESKLLVSHFLTELIACWKVCYSDVGEKTVEIITNHFWEDTLRSSDLLWQKVREVFPFIFLSEKEVLDSIRKKRREENKEGRFTGFLDAIKKMNTEGGNSVKWHTENFGASNFMGSGINKELFTQYWFDDGEVKSPPLTKAMFETAMNQVMGMNIK